MGCNNLADILNCTGEMESENNTQVSNRYFNMQVFLIFFTISNPFEPFETYEPIEILEPFEPFEPLELLEPLEPFELLEPLELPEPFEP